VAGRLIRQGGPPLYQQVGDLIREKVMKRELAIGEPLPPYRDLGKLCDVSEITVRRAISELVAEGLLVSHRGSGTYILKGPHETPGNRSRPRKDKAPDTHGRDDTQTQTLPVGIVVTSLTDGYPFMSQVIHGVRQGLGETHSLQFFEQPPFTSMTNLPLDRLGGLLIHSPVNLQLVVRCQQLGLPYVLMHNDLSDGYSHCTLIDYAQAMLLAAKHLIERGKRHIAMVTAAPNRFSTAKMVAGYWMALHHYELKAPEMPIVHGGYGEEHGYASTLELLKQSQKPDAIVYASDFQARGGLRAAMEQGLRIPEDLSLIGSGNILGPRVSPIDITTIDPHYDRIGLAGASVLKNLMLGTQYQPFCHVIEPELIVRQTT
jgi:DNA-binding LacI/PurR family transcriptional regulator/DNA-binding transcriptional regulator YhcF (GntR family)